MELTNPICSQCGTAHPMLAPGERCPMMPETAKSGMVLNFNEVFAPLQNILKAQVDMKGIRDFDKFGKYMIVEITKAAEAYKED